MANEPVNVVVGAGWLDGLVKRLRQQHTRVLAPVTVDDAVEFREIQQASEIATDYINTRLPAKEILFPRTEVLLEYDQAPGEATEVAAGASPPSPTVVLGTRPCDLRGLNVLDTVFNWDYRDTPYAERREQTTFAGFACTTAGPDCFCRSVGGAPDDCAGSDLLVRPMQDGGAVVTAVNERGQALLECLDATRPATGDEDLVPAPEMETRFDVDAIRQWLDAHFEDDLWVDVSLKCLGCGACTFLCPTCHCFDIVDEGDWRSGERRRNWDCCAFSQFTQHASGHNPRPNESSRCRNRVMHKFSYFPERFDQVACVGCGRCIGVCGAGENIGGILSAIAERAAQPEEVTP